MGLKLFVGCGGGFESGDGDGLGCGGGEDDGVGRFRFTGCVVWRCWCVECV